MAPGTRSTAHSPGKSPSSPERRAKQEAKKKKEQEQAKALQEAQEKEAKEKKAREDKARAEKAKKEEERIAQAKAAKEADESFVSTKPNLKWQDVNKYYKGRETIKQLASTPYYAKDKSESGNLEDVHYYEQDLEDITKGTACIFYQTNAPTNAQLTMLKEDAMSKDGCATVFAEILAKGPKATKWLTSIQLEAKLNQDKTRNRTNQMPR